MAETSGTWTYANALALAVYRGAAVPGTDNDGVQRNVDISATANWAALSPTTYPVAAGTHWWLGIGTSDTATNMAAPPSGLTNVASSASGKAGVHDTGAASSSNWSSTSVTLNASGLWTTSIVQIPAAPSQTVSRVGCSAAESTSVSVPPGHQVGDLMVMHALSYSGNLPLAPAGWTGLTGSNSGAILSWALWYRIAVSPDSVFVPQIAVY